MNAAKLITILIAAAALTPSANARIADTEAQAEERYGKPVESQDGSEERHKIRLYNFNGYIIAVHFLDGKSHCELIKKEDKTTFSETETTTILSANRFNSEWKHESGNERTGFWVYQLGSKLSAVRDDNKGLLLIQSTIFEEFRSQTKAAAEKRRLEGF